MTKTKNSIFSIIILFFIIALIVIRLIISETPEHWVSTMNFLGLLLAAGSLFVKSIAKCRENKYSAPFFGGFFVVLIVLVLLLALVFTQTITLCSKANDIVFLATLLLSLPSDIYEMLIYKITDKGEII